MLRTGPDRSRRRSRSSRRWPLAGDEVVDLGAARCSVIGCCAQPGIERSRSRGGGHGHAQLSTRAGVGACRGGLRRLGGVCVLGKTCGTPGTRRLRDALLMACRLIREAPPGQIARNRLCSIPIRQPGHSDAIVRRARFGLRLIPNSHFLLREQTRLRPERNLPDHREQARYQCRRRQ